MAKYKSTAIRLGSLLIACALFTLGPDASQAEDAKKKNKAGKPAPAQQQAQSPKKDHAGHNHGAHGHAGHNHKGHNHGAHGQPSQMPAVSDKKDLGLYGKGLPPLQPPPELFSHGPGVHSQKKQSLQKLMTSPTLQLAFKKKGPLVEEQRKHATRLSQLNRIIELAQRMRDGATVQLAEDLKKKETKRHYRKLSKLRKKYFFQARAANFPMQGMPTGMPMPQGGKPMPMPQGGKPMPMPQGGNSPR